MSYGPDTALAGVPGSELAVPPQPSSTPRGWRQRAGSFTTTLVRFKPRLVLSALFVALLLIAAIAPGLVAPKDPLEANARLAFRAPSWTHPLGTDENGRDLYTRLVHGVRPSLVMGLAATAIGLGFGVAIGLTAGLGPRFLDGAFMRGVDVLLAFPDLMFALLIITFWGQGTLNAIVAVGIASVPRYARLIRAQTHVVRRTAYIEAAVTLGLSRWQIIARHVLPNAIGPVLILATIGIGGKIAAGASLSFLGLGTPPPAPEWGSMLSIGRNYLANAWWLTAVPGIAVTLTVLSISCLGRELLRRSEGKTTA